MNMTIDYINRTVLPAALGLLPLRMNTDAGKALTLAIGLQESRFIYRHQIKGPATGFWQFESTGVHGILTHKATQGFLYEVLASMSYPAITSVIHAALEDNDVLACVCARLLLWADSKPLPHRGQASEAWDYYIRGWRPGKPHRETWDAFYSTAWIAATGVRP